MIADSVPPLDGIRVLDASRVLAGPFCGQLLGDLGAEVIKVERPGQGDETRTWGPPFAGSLSAYYLSCNRSKRAVTLDMGRPEGVRIFHELARRSDVILENFRTQSADRLGVSPEKLHAIQPRLVICSISGFGRTGPMSDEPGYDFAVQALSGLMSITGPVEGPPSKVGVAVADVITGLYAATSVLACLQAREKSGHGYAIDLALLDCAVAAQVNVAQAYLTSGEVPARQGNAHLQIVPYQLFGTADGWIVLAVGNDGQWQRFCAGTQRADLGIDQRFATNTQRVGNRGVLVPIVAEVMRQRTTADWQSLLERAQVPHAPVWNYQQLFGHPQAEARGLCVTVRDAAGQPVKLLGNPIHIAGAALPQGRMPPDHGQDNESVFREMLGMTDDEMEVLRKKGVI
jgi:crotonobetainyl-CoA:carnitine CoA-transferase CaiB-like acyl-CoA transferase